MTKGSLQFVPEGYRVVPEEPTEEQCKIIRGYLDCNMPAPYVYIYVPYLYEDIIEASPPLTTPPMLRWESDRLFCGNSCMCRVFTSISGELFMLSSPFLSSGEVYRSKDKARRAAEKALGIPFEVEEV